MKVFVEIQNPVGAAVKQTISLIDKVEFVDTVKEADVIIVNEAKNVLSYLKNNKHVVLISSEEMPLDLGDISPFEEKFKAFSIFGRKGYPPYSKIFEYLTEISEK